MRVGEVLAPGTATAVGSLPHRDAATAASLVLDALPELPAAPSLPRRHAHEGMLAQGALGIDGVDVADDGTLVVPGALRASTPVDDPAGRHGLPVEAHRGALALLDVLAARLADGARAPRAVKLQHVGPVTLAAALVAGGARPAVARETAAVAVRHRLGQLVRAAAATLPTVPLLVVLDEPSLGASAAGEGGIGDEEVVDLLSGGLAAVEAAAPPAGVVAGVHCCATTDWSLVLRAGPDVVSLPVDLAPALRPSELGPFLERGGWVAWGAVPTGGPMAAMEGDGPSARAEARLWRTLGARWHAYDDAGLDPVLLRQQAVVTPACGLAGHHPAGAALALGLTAALGARLATGRPSPETTA